MHPTSEQVVVRGAQSEVAEVTRPGGISWDALKSECVVQERGERSAHGAATRACALGGFSGEVSAQLAADEAVLCLPHV